MSAPHPSYTDNGDPLPAFLRRNAPVREPVYGLCDSLIDRVRMLEDDVARNRLDDIANLIQSLTYGEMMELAAKLWAARTHHGIHPEAMPITKEELPKLWHNWSTNHG